MKKKKNSFWDFFASTKLALFCFFTLAFASIVGTIIPQNESPVFYIQKYGENRPTLSIKSQSPAFNTGIDFTCRPDRVTGYDGGNDGLN